MQMFGRTVIYTDVTSVTAENVRDVLYRFLQQIPAVFGGDFAWRNRVCPSRIRMYQMRFLYRAGHYADVFCGCCNRMNRSNA